MHRDNVAITCRRQRDEAQIENRIGEAGIVLKSSSVESSRKRQADEHKERSERNRDEKIQQDSAGDPVIVDLAGAENRLRHHQTERDRYGQPGTGQQMQIVGPGVKQPRDENDHIRREGDRHHSQRHRVIGNNQHAADDRQQGGDREDVKHKDAQRLQRREHEDRQGKQYRQQREQAVAVLAPQVAHTENGIRHRPAPGLALHAGTLELWCKTDGRPPLI